MSAYIRLCHLSEHRIRNAVLAPPAVIVARLALKEFPFIIVNKKRNSTLFILFNRVFYNSLYSRYSYICFYRLTCVFTGLTCWRDWGFQESIKANWSTRCCLKKQTIISGAHVSYWKKLLAWKITTKLVKRQNKTGENISQWMSVAVLQQCNASKKKSITTLFLDFSNYQWCKGYRALCWQMS